jgi:hypothetical protein
MNIYENIKKLEHTNAHGEINFYRIVEGAIDLPEFKSATDKTASGDYIVGHSESGHHHVLERDDVEITEFVNDGMKMFHAIVEKQTRLYQDAGAPHAEQIIEPGEYIIGCSLDYDPFTQQARRVAD